MAAAAVPLAAEAPLAAAAPSAAAASSAGCRAPSAFGRPAVAAPWAAQVVAAPARWAAAPLAAMPLILPLPPLPSHPPPRWQRPSSGPVPPRAPLRHLQAFPKAPAMVIGAFPAVPCIRLGQPAAPATPTLPCLQTTEPHTRTERLRCTPPPWQGARRDHQKVALAAWPLARLCASSVLWLCYAALTRNVL